MQKDDKRLINKYKYLKLKGKTEKKTPCGDVCFGF